jgi:hypothetical protein
MFSEKYLVNFTVPVIVHYCDRNVRVLNYTFVVNVNTVCIFWVYFSVNAPTVKVHLFVSAVKTYFHTVSIVGTCRNIYVCKRR